MRSILTILLLLSSSTIASTQDFARVAFNAQGEMKSMVFIDRAFRDNKFCKRQPVLSGEIADVDFDVDGRITEFHLTYSVRKKIKRWSFGFPEEIYGNLKPVEIQKLPTLFKKGIRVSLSFYTCGERATLDIINEIRRLK